jgi:hypothetical protein
VRGNTTANRQITLRKHGVTVLVNRPAVEAGLAILDAGGENRPDNRNRQLVLLRFAGEAERE